MFAYSFIGSSAAGKCTCGSNYNLVLFLIKFGAVNNYSSFLLARFAFQCLLFPVRYSLLCVLRLLLLILAFLTSSHLFVHVLLSIVFLYSYLCAVTCNWLSKCISKNIMSFQIFVFGYACGLASLCFLLLFHVYSIFLLCGVLLPVRFLF